MGRNTKQRTRIDQELNEQKMKQMLTQIRKEKKEQEIREQDEIEYIDNNVRNG